MAAPWRERAMLTGVSTGSYSLRSIHLQSIRRGHHIRHLFYTNQSQVIWHVSDWNIFIRFLVEPGNFLSVTASRFLLGPKNLLFCASRVTPLEEETKWTPSWLLTLIQCLDQEHVQLHLHFLKWIKYMEILAFKFMNVDFHSECT
jgi:hypothetical protein